MANEYINTFLDMLVELARSNPTLNITDRLIYAQLVSFRLGSGVIPFENVEKYFRNWITEFQSNPLIDVYRDKTNPYICHFNSKYENDDIKNNIKIFIPMDAEHIKDGVLDLFNYLTTEKIVHTSKVVSAIRNDNVIVRVSKIEDVNKIVKYIKNNSYLSEGLLNSNPFLITCYKLGVIVDNNYTYNVEITKILAAILEELRNNNKLDKFNVTYLKKIFTKLSLKCADDELSELYKLVSIVLDENSNLQDFANYVIEYQQTSYINKHGNNSDAYNNSIDYFNSAIIETFKRYNNLSFVINAVKLYLNTGNVNGFTRINGARKKLSLYVDKNKIESLFEKDNLDFSIKYYLLKVITNNE